MRLTKAEDPTSTYIIIPIVNSKYMDHVLEIWRPNYFGALVPLPSPHLRWAIYGPVYAWLRDKFICKSK
jgi:hypothetical protein